MELKLFDTLTKEKQVFRPLDPNNVRMYVCGPTVYDFAHIGNARPVIVFDVLFRLLRHVYGADHVTYVRNITDVDDKINARAALDFPGLPLNDAIRQVTEKTEAQFHADVAALGCLPPTFEPRATEHIGQMIDIIGKLLENGCAYIAHGESGREVLFSVSKMPHYGVLSNRKLDEQKPGARVAVEAHKKHPLDFVLWKESSANEPGWTAKFRPDPDYRSNNDDEITIYGRPGWHIECSAMSMAKLLTPFGGGLECTDPTKNVFDIHGGGIDLVFPHHENEIAQSCCAFGTERMANIWMHNGFLQVEGEKMSKSLGNFVTIRELLNGWNGLPWAGEIIRLAMLSTHYRQPIDFSVNALEQAMISLRYFKHFSYGDIIEPPTDEFIEAMFDDMNTPRAIAELHRLVKVAREEDARFIDDMSRSGIILDDSAYLAHRQIMSGLKLLGIDITKYDPDYIQKRARAGLASNDTSKIDSLIAARTAARAAKDFKESDRIRDELAAMGIVLKDGKDENGNPTTTWEIAR